MRIFIEKKKRHDPFTCRLVRGRRAIRWPLRSNKRICRLSCGIAIMPPFDTEIRLTAESSLMVVKADRIFLSSHTLTVLSSEPDTTLSSLVSTVDVTLLQKYKSYFFKKKLFIYFDRKSIVLTLYALGIPKPPVFDL